MLAANAFSPVSKPQWYPRANKTLFRLRLINPSLASITAAASLRCSGRISSYSFNPFDRMMSLAVSTISPTNIFDIPANMIKPFGLSVTPVAALNNLRSIGLLRFDRL